ncbi:MAG TPA: hypothetical protein V6C46_06565, partial [Coleofasciculaceae cyanobacterium]
LLESTVMLLFASPLLTLAGFYDPPFHLKAEEAVQLTLADSEEVLQGRLDLLHRSQGRLASSTKGRLAAHQGVEVTTQLEH